MRSVLPLVQADGAIIPNLSDFGHPLPAGAVSSRLRCPGAARASAADNLVAVHRCDVVSRADLSGNVVRGMGFEFFRQGLVVLALLPWLLAACAGNPGGSLARQCSNGLDQAFRELDLAEADGFGGTVDWAKAASLLTAAKVQYEFEHYPNCIEKVGRARVYIRQSKGG